MRFDDLVRRLEPFVAAIAARALNDMASLQAVRYEAQPSGGYTASATPFLVSPPFVPITVTDWDQRVYVSGANDASNYWTLTLYRVSGGTSTAITSLTTASISAGSWQMLSASGLSATLSVAADHLVISIAKSGSPGSLYLGAPIVKAR